MSERMTPIPFKQLMTWIKEEHDNFGTVFGVNAPYVKKNGKTLPLFKEKLETPFGPAAGPNTQLAQNIVAAYYAGARFFELKTVQKMDGDDLAACINRPCIWTKDEGYNCEWSTELYVPQAFDVADELGSSKLIYGPLVDLFLGSYQLILEAKGNAGGGRDIVTGDDALCSMLKGHFVAQLILYG